jgi:hypothetical protein
MANSDSDLKVTFANARGDAVHLGPFHRLLFDGANLKDGDRRVIANHRNHQWELAAGALYSRVECYLACSLWFHTLNPADGNSRRSGPYSTLSPVDGVLYADQRIIAFCDSQLNDWYSFDFGQHYRRILVSPYRPQGGPPQPMPAR